MTTAPPAPTSTDTLDSRGLTFGVGAYALWGLFPLYWPLLEPSGAVEILAHRIFWSMVFVAGLVTVTRRWRTIRALRRRQVLLLAGAALVISVNWGLYIWGVNNDHVVETSLGYFINPLVTVVLGVVVLSERLRRLQWVAIGIGMLAVGVLTVDYGRPPWIALTLACSFGSYGLAKKFTRTDAVTGLTVETAVLTGPALAYLGWLTSHGDASFGHHGVGHALLLAATGVVSGIPLLLFAGAAGRLPLSVLGLLQYLTPSLQFLCGVLVFHEPMPAGRLAGFALVWVALVLLTAESLRHRRQVMAAA